MIFFLCKLAAGYLRVSRIKLAIPRFELSFVRVQPFSKVMPKTCLLDSNIQPEMLNLLDGRVTLVCAIVASKLLSMGS